MAIQINSRLTLRRTRFSVLSLIQLQDFLLNLSQKDENTQADAWQDMYDSIYNGSLFRWLDRQNLVQLKNEFYKLLLNRNLVDYKFALLHSFVETLFKNDKSSNSTNCLKYLENKLDEEKTLTTSEHPVIGRNWLLSLNEHVKIPLVWVEGGTFKMGSEDNEADEDEKPVHTVTLSGYWIGRYPVTQEQWETIGTKRSKKNHFEGKFLPVESISWNEANKFCREMSKHLKEKIQWKEDDDSDRLSRFFGDLGEKDRVVEKKYQFTLPTEAQWEFAARGGRMSQEYKYSGSNNLDEVAWFWENSERVRDIGLKMPNELGIHDMSGNVWEWCRDWYDYYSAENQKDPAGPDRGSYRVIRGGSWGNSAGLCRPSCRIFGDPTLRDGDVGFRVTLVPVQE